MEQITYIKTGDYYIPDWKLAEDLRPIGRWGRIHRDYLKEHRPVVFNQLVLSGKLWAYLADINEQAQLRMTMTSTVMIWTALSTTHTSCCPLYRQFTMGNGHWKM